MKSVRSKTDDPDLRRVLDEQLRLAYGQTARTVFGGSGVSLLLVWSLWSVADQGLLSVWLACQVGLSALRGFNYLAYRRRAAESGHAVWQATLICGAFLQGCLWGAAWWLFLPVPGQPEYTVLVAAFMIGLTGASVSAYSVSAWTMIAFSMPVLLPGIPRTLMLDEPLGPGLAVALAVYAYIVISSMLPISRGMIAAIRLNFENAREITERERVEALLRELSITDGLTGLATRRHFDEVLRREIERARRSDLPVALVLADIDCFKLLNDSLGHVEGDRCLRRVAEVVAAAAQRTGDLAARYGGEEFALILPDTELDQAVRIADRLRQRVAELEQPNPATRVAGTDRVTLSAGIAAVVPDPGLRAEDLIERADRALYRAKESGRNRVETG